MKPTGSAGLPQDGSDLRVRLGFGALVLILVTMALSSASITELWASDESVGLSKQLEGLRQEKGNGRKSVNSRSKEKNGHRSKPRTASTEEPTAPPVTGKVARLSYLEQHLADMQRKLGVPFVDNGAGASERPFRKRPRGTKAATAETPAEVSSDEAANRDRKEIAVKILEGKSERPSKGKGKGKPKTHPPMELGAWAQAVGDPFRGGRAINSYRTPHAPPAPAALDDTSVTLDEIQELLQLDRKALETLVQVDYAKTLTMALARGKAFPEADDVIPVVATPLFMDGFELRDMLRSLDVPVRLMVFVWNSEDSAVKQTLEPLRLLEGKGVVIHHHPENVGFSAAINLGIKSGEQLLTNPPSRWTFACNADASFRSGVLRQFAFYANRHWEEYGLLYGPRQDHFAFAITASAVEKAGYMDEVFYPGYMEDIDYRWRVRLAGLGQIITGAQFDHKHSVNSKRHGPAAQLYAAMKLRASEGWAYGFLKWGNYGPGHIEDDAPPSGWRTPFNIPDAPLSLWVIDPIHRECIRTSNGLYYPNSQTCWYNGTNLLSKLPEGTSLPPQLLDPGANTFPNGPARPPPPPNQPYLEDLKDAKPRTRPSRRRGR